MAARRGRRVRGCIAARRSTTRRAPRSRVDAKLYGVEFGDGAYGAQDSTLDFEIGRRQVVKADATSHRIQVLDRGRQRDHGLPLQLRRGRPAAQHHPQRHPRGHREVRGLLHVQPRRPGTPTSTSGGRCGSPTTASSSTPTRRVLARRATATSPTGASTCPPTMPSSTSAPRSTATLSRSPGPRSTCPTPTATSGTGPCRGTSGWRCRRCSPQAAPPQTAIPSTAPVTPTRSRCEPVERRRPRRFGD